jgi:hypothetical protein
MAADLKHLTTTTAISTAISLTRTPEGWHAFDMIFKAKLGTVLQASLEHAIEKKQLDPIDARQAALFQHIHNALIIAIQDECDLIADLAALPAPSNGIKEYLHLQHELAGQTIAKDLTGIASIVNTSLQTNTVEQVKLMLATNRQLQHQFPSQLMVSLILSKLPEKFATIRDIIVEREVLPDGQTLIHKLHQHDSINVDTSERVSAFMAGKPFHCHNCDKVDAHPPGKCNRPQVGCDHCGAQAWHMTKFCWVPNDKPLPQHWNNERKEQMERKRKDYKIKKTDEKAAALFADKDKEPSLSQMRALISDTNDRLSI